MTRWHVDAEVPELKLVSCLEVLADGVDVPATNVLISGLDALPCAPDEEHEAGKAHVAHLVSYGPLSISVVGYRLRWRCHRIPT